VSGGASPGATGRLLDLVRRLIAFGKALAGTLQDCASADTLATVTRCFGCADVAVIIARIMHGLQLAAALEAGLISGVAAWRLGPIRVPSPRNPSGIEPAEHTDEQPVRRVAGGARRDDAPTVEAIAADVHRRPVGAVIADICRDFGIVRSHPLWDELTEAVMFNGGNFPRLCGDVTRRGAISLGDPSCSPDPWLAATQEGARLSPGVTGAGPS
jgi:hypothetical protein